MCCDEWIDRVIQYARYSGQNLLVYPMAWYHGPLFPSQREPSGAFDVVVARDRKQYVRWTTTPTDWYAKLLKRCDQEGLEFQGAMTLMRLGSLLEKMNINLDAIQGGADTFNNLLWNNLRAIEHQRLDAHLQRSQLQTLTEGQSRTRNRWSRGRRPPRDSPMARPATPGHAGPMFNPLHPTVQEAIIGFVREIGQRYGKHPAFKGISFNMFALGHALVRLDSFRIRRLLGGPVPKGDGH